MMRLATMAALGALVLAVGPARADDKDKDKDKPQTEQNDNAKFQGTWKPEKMVRFGNAAPADEMEKMSIEFKGNKAIPQREGKSEKEAEFTIDSTKTPKHFEIKTPDGKTLQGIYEFDGDTLKICLVEEGDRPTKFDSAEGSKNMLIVLKRQKK
jgi:uncharacterized protein (TIGR03067 family)